MFKVKIACVGKIKESFYREAVDEYIKRLGRFCDVRIVETAECPVYKPCPTDGETAKVRKAEAAGLLAAMEGFCVCLDIGGAEMSSERFAEQLRRIKDVPPVVTLAIGGSYGMDDSVKNACKLKLSFGRMTYPHQLMRVVLCEQIYRAFMIDSGSAYHK